GSATAAQVSTDLFGGDRGKSGGTFLALRDGSYLAVGGVAEGKPTPARHLVVGPQSATASFVADTAPTVQPLAAEWNQYFNYELATPASDGSILLYSANWTGVVGYLDVVGGTVKMLANDVRIGVEGFSDQAGSDAAHGLD
ncbi:hypothetical protein QU816_27640, partial [Klebsiella pneumoniae]|uniref:hypothetical protein n=1 Tax=Klebsiella pneumoniae TaxID=573 RepID=UPI0022319DDB